MNLFFYQKIRPNFITTKNEQKWKVQKYVIKLILTVITSNINKS